MKWHPDGMILAAGSQVGLMLIQVQLEVDWVEVLDVGFLEFLVIER